MTIKPLKDRILVQQIEENQSSGGIIIPSNSKENTHIGEVIAVGKDVEEVCAKDTVAFDKNLTTALDVEGQNYLIIKEKDVLAIFKY